MDFILSELRKHIKGEVLSDLIDRQRLSHDASIYELTPEAVIKPKNAEDIERIVKLVSKHKQTYPQLSITPRSAGTDMSGGAIGNSLLLDMTAHFHTIESFKNNVLRVQPGTFIRNIDPILFKEGRHIKKADKLDRYLPVELTAPLAASLAITRVASNRFATVMPTVGYAS